MMSLPGFDELMERADRTQSRRPAVAVGGADDTVLRAFREAADRGWIDPILTGKRADLEAMAAVEGVSLDGMRILDTEDPALTAVAEIRAGRAALLAKGQVSTPRLMHALLDREHGLRTDQPIVQIVLMELPRDGRRLLLADTGIVIRPDLETKRRIIAHVVEVAGRLGESEPRVALLAASETTTDAMPETIEAAQLEQEAIAGLLAGRLVQGPLSFDLAYSVDAGDKKRHSGPVVGAADALVFPDLLSANLTVKAIMYTADSRYGGVLRGAACPVAFMSRSDTMETRLRSLALALALAEPA